MSGWHLKGLNPILILMCFFHCSHWTTNICNEWYGWLKSIIYGIENLHNLCSNMSDKLIESQIDINFNVNLADTITSRSRHIPSNPLNSIIESMVPIFASFFSYSICHRLAYLIMISWYSCGFHWKTKKENSFGYLFPMAFRFEY